ncbi:hypothetical protein [uncultured Methanoregula sp.]|uniref:hypothetical protein n=1 Tax=uncultured Methanoregula sp. TaxID=1005933 RepID=UPI002AAB6A15|nr:hypothetical protein [uncultured Methanoregula sp.]
MMEKSAKLALDNERLDIEKVFRAAQVVRESFLDESIPDDEKKEALFQMHGKDPWQLSRRYMEIQDLQWADAMSPAPAEPAEGESV